MANNGRVSDINVTPMAAYVMTDFKQDKTFGREATRGIVARNPVSDLFFSDLNIDALQQGIRSGVYYKSCQKYNIGRQSDEELKVIMRSIYLQYAKNRPFDIVEQVRELNAYVLTYAVERVLNEVSMYNRYRQDLASLPEPMERSANTSSKGSRTLEIKEF